MEKNIQQLRADIEQYIDEGATDDEIADLLNTHRADRQDLIAVIGILLDELNDLKTPETEQ